MTSRSRNDLITPIAKQLKSTLEQIANKTDLAEAVREHTRLLKLLQDTISEVSQARRKAVRGLKANGFSYQQIGEAVGLHKQTVVVIDKGRDSSPVS